MTKVITTSLTVVLAFYAIAMGQTPSSKDIDLKALSDKWIQTGEISVLAHPLPREVHQKKLHTHTIDVNDPAKGKLTYNALYVTNIWWELTEHGHCRFFCELSCSYVLSPTKLERTLAIMQGDKTTVVDRKEWHLVNGGIGVIYQNCNETRAEWAIKKIRDPRLGTYETYRRIIDQDSKSLDGIYKKTK